MLGFQGGVSIPLVKGGVKAPPAKRQCRAGPKEGARRGFTCVRTNMQDARRVANPTGIHRHVDNLLFDCRRLPRVAILQQERTPRAAFFSAPVPLLALPGLAMAHNVGPVTVRTVQDLENHEATRSRWG